MDTGTVAGNGRYTSRAYFRLVEQGLVDPDERIELLDGIVVSMPPQAPPHAAGVRRAHRVLATALAGRGVLSSQLPFVAGLLSVPEPDFALLPGCEADYASHHPTSALLVVEISDSTLMQDRLTKSRIYAGALVPEYWIVNLRDLVVEWYVEPDAELRVYRRSGKAGYDDRLPLVAFPGASIVGGDLLPAPGEHPSR